MVDQSEFVSIEFFQAPSRCRLRLNALAPILRNASWRKLAVEFLRVLLRGMSRALALRALPAESEKARYRRRPQRAGAESKRRDCIDIGQGAGSCGSR